MYRLLPLLLLAACAVDNSTAGALPASPDTALAPGPQATTEPVPVPTPPTPAPDPAPGTLVLAAGEQAEFAPRSTLRYDKLLNDSRCPAGAQCVWAGEVRLALTLTVTGKAEAFELASAHEHTKVVQGIEVHLLDYGPCPLGHGAPGLECASLTAAAQDGAGSN
jgi:hypothetical protein